MPRGVGRAESIGGNGSGQAVNLRQHAGGLDSFRRKEWSSGSHAYRLPASTRAVRRCVPGRPARGSRLQSAAGVVAFAAATLTHLRGRADGSSEQWRDRQQQRHKQ